jgi:gas vesicle protein
MAHDNNNLTKGLLLGFVAGGAVGAILALLYAPKSGKELRADIKLKTDDYLDEAEKYLAEAKDKAKDMINEGRKRSEKIITDAKSKSDEILKDAEKIFHDAKSKSSETFQHSKEKIESEAGRIKDSVKAGIDAYKEAKKS